MEKDERSYLLEQIALLKRVNRRWKSLVVIGAMVMVAALFGFGIFAAAQFSRYQAARMEAQMQAVKAEQQAMQAVQNLQRIEEKLRAKERSRADKPKNP